MAIVVGIGLNINATLDGFPDELRTGATSLSAEGGRSFDRVAILADLYFRLEQRLDRLLLDGPTGMIDEFTQCCSTLGHRVRVTLEEQAWFRASPNRSARMAVSVSVWCPIPTLL